jgi:hypothetical protein
MPMTKKEFDRRIAEATARAERQNAYREAEYRWALHVGMKKQFDHDVQCSIARARQYHELLDASDARLAEDAERRVNASRFMMEHARRPPAVAAGDAVGMLPRNRPWDT